MIYFYLVINLFINLFFYFSLLFFMQHHLGKWYCEINVVVMLSVPNARFKFVGSVAGLRARDKVQ